MDTSKLLHVLKDLNTSDETNIQELLANLTRYIRSNDSANITSTISELEAELDIEVINKYNQSDIEILEKIGGKYYFGSWGKYRLNNLLTDHSYDLTKTIDGLGEYATERKEFSDRITQVYDDLVELNIKVHKPAGNIFEVGLLMPTKYTHQKIPFITKELNRWDKIFKTFKELTGETPEDTEINFVSNGSLQFFIDNSPEVAVCLAVTIERVVNVYKKIIDIRVTRLKLKDLGVSISEQKSIEKQEKEILNKEIDKIALDIIKEFALKSIDTGRTNELKIAVKGHVTYIAKCIDGGMTIEINPPAIDLPKNLSDKEDGKKIKADYDKILKQIEVAQKSMDVLTSIGKTGIDIVKYLTDGEKDSDDDTSDDHTDE